MTLFYLAAIVNRDIKGFIRYMNRNFVTLSSECKCVNGICNEGVSGDGSCFCHHGWKGRVCNTCKLILTTANIFVLVVVGPLKVDPRTTQTLTKISEDNPTNCGFAEDEAKFSAGVRSRAKIPRYCRKQLIRRR